MLKFKSNQSEVQNLLKEFFNNVDDCLKQFAVYFSEFIRNGDFVRLETGVQEVASREHRADEIRRQTEMLLYTKALFPESRGDILGLLESLDRVPNKAEGVITRLLLYQIAMPSSFSEDYVTLAHLSVEAGMDTVTAARTLFSSYKNAIPMAEVARRKEHEADNQEMSLLRRIFQSEIDLEKKLWLSEICRDLSDIADRAEDTADRVMIIAAKRII